MKISQPVGIVSMTNVAIIKYRTNKKTFEIACYKNKAINWRNKVEKDLNEVLQIDEIYTSASHGQIASKQELNNYFAGMSTQSIIQTILEKGDLQIGDKEREVQIDSMYKDIVKFIQEKCVHPVSKRPFNQKSIEHAISKTSFIVKPDQNVKKQALDCIKLLRESFFIERAEMKISITSQQENDKDALTQILKNLDIQIENISFQKTNDQTLNIVAVINPSTLRPLSQILKEQFKKTAIEVLDANLQKNQVEDIAEAGAVELEMRKEKLQIDSDSDQEHKGKSKGKKDKKDKQKGNQKQKGQKEEVEEQKQAPQQQQQQQTDGPQKQFRCNNCLGAQFDTNPEFREHYKSDWHNFNLKMKTKGQQPISKEDFLEMILSEEMKK